MRPVSLALFWHQHQPYYPDDVSGENPMPWVRLHGTKDYFGMAAHLEEVPEFQCTINLVPSLLLQIQQYTDHDASDRHLDVSRCPADGLNETDAAYLVDNFFMANVDNMIRPYARYFDLYLKRGFNVDSAHTALRRFTERDLRDLQVWSNLTWFHPLAFERDPELKAFLDKGKHWTEDEKDWLLERQMDLLRQIIPMHRKLADSGQVELTTTPFYHPILPLLWNKMSAREAMPGCALPRHLETYEEDAIVHLERAVHFHEETFGHKPVGMWPSEGSVSEEILSAIANVGIKWIATDEEVLSESTNQWVARDAHGHIRNPEMLFRPWLVGNDPEQLQIVFRDHALSDLIGFHYQRSDPAEAAADLLSRVESIAQAVDGRSGGMPAIVPIILDGENCWEYYPDGGVGFLRELYTKAVEHKHIRPVRIGDHVSDHPAVDRINHLFAGSWISHNFAIWIGHHEDVKAWELLHDTRQFLVRIEDSGDARPDQLKRAWDELYIAEGSDWYWWFGDDHSSALDSMFDQLFRKHLMNVYTLLGAEYPLELNQPITSGSAHDFHTQPTGLLDVRLDGRKTFFEWISAGQYTAGNERGTMTQVTDGIVTDLFFGFDLEHLFLRVDTQFEATDDLTDLDELRIHLLEPHAGQIRIVLENGRVAAAILVRPEHDGRIELEAEIGKIMEISVPLRSAGLVAGDLIQMYVELRRNEQSVERAPQEGTIQLRVPNADFEMIMWQA